MKPKITLNNIRSFLTGYSRKFWKEYLSDIVDFPPHIQAQVLERIKLIEQNSPECLKENACQKCGHKCTVDALVYDNNSCAGNCFPPIKSKEEWETFQELPGREGTQFKIKLSKDHFSGNMTPEQIEDIARDLGFYDSVNIKPLENKE